MTDCIQCGRGLTNDQRCVCQQCFDNMPVLFRVMWANAKRPATQRAVIRLVERHVAELKATSAELDADAELGRQRIAELEKT